MDKFRDFGILSVEKAVWAIKLVQYFIFLVFTPILESITSKLLLRCDIVINGERPWDIQVVNRKFYARLTAFGILGLGESFMDKWIECKDPEGMAYRMAKNGVLKMYHSMPWNRILHYLRWNFFNLQTKERASNSCNPHYNLGTEFFESFLDESNTYSVAYWNNTSKNLAEAQIAKMELAAQKLQLKPGMKVLDLGCGFGSLAKYLAKNYQVQVVGITNSIKMGEEAALNCEGHSIEIQVTDWRDLEGKFDRVVCIEMVLHVGRHNLKQLFNQVNKWLKNDGLFVMQDFGMEHGYPNADDFFCKYFFPNVYVGTLEEIMENSRGALAFEHFQDMTEDLVKTDRALFQAFHKNWPKIKDTYDEKLYEAMRFYFNFGAGVGRARMFLAYQMVFRKVN